MEEYKTVGRRYHIGESKFFLEIWEDEENYEAWIGEENQGIKTLIMGSPKHQPNCIQFKDGIQTYDDFLKVVQANIDEEVLNFMHEMEEYESFLDTMVD